MPHEKIAISFVNGHKLDLVNGTLLNKDINVPIRPKSFALLRYLVLNSGRVISKEELFEAVWGNIAVTDDALTQTIRDVRRAIADVDNSVLRTVAKRGYLLTVQHVEPEPLADTHDGDPMPGVEQVLRSLVRGSISAQVKNGTETGTQSQAGPRDHSPTAGNRATGRSRPSVVVLPFELPQAHAEHLLHIRNGLLKEISGQLLELQGLFVIDASASAIMVDSPLHWMDVGKLLQCDYVCTGRLEESEEWLHLAIEMNATDDGRLLLSERLSRPRGGALQYDSELASEIARTIESEIESSERHRTFKLQPFELDSWQAFHRGMWHMMRFNRDDVLRSVTFFNLSIARDPTFWRAYSALAFTHWLNSYLGADNQEDECRRPFERIIRLGDPSATNMASTFSNSSSGACSADRDLAIELQDRTGKASSFVPQRQSVDESAALALLWLGRIESTADRGWRATRHPAGQSHMQRTAVAASATAKRRKLAARSGEDPRQKLQG